MNILLAILAFPVVAAFGLFILALADEFIVSSRAKIEKWIISRQPLQTKENAPDDHPIHKYKLLWGKKICRFCIIEIEQHEGLGKKLGGRKCLVCKYHFYNPNLDEHLRKQALSKCSTD